MIADRLLGQYRERCSRRHHHRARALHARVPVAALLLCRAHPDRRRAPGCSSRTSARWSARSIAQGDTRRDAGFSIFYMGINLGAFSRPARCGYLAQRVNWHIGFAAAGVGMALGLVQYVLGRRRLKTGVARLGQQPAVPTADTRGREARRRRAAASAGDEWKRIERASSIFFTRRRFCSGAGTSRQVDAESLRRSLYAARSRRLLVPLVVVPVGAADLRDSARAGVRAGSGSGSGATSRRCRRSSPRACCSWACRLWC